MQFLLHTDRKAVIQYKPGTCEKYMLHEKDRNCAGLSCVTNYKTNEMNVLVVEVWVAELMETKRGNKSIYTTNYIVRVIKKMYGKQ